MKAIADTTAEVRVVAYDLNEPGVVKRLLDLGKRVRVIIDDDGSHGEAQAGEAQAEQQLVASAGRNNVKRQHMGKLQHNKTIVVDGPAVQAVVCGSTKFQLARFLRAIEQRGGPPQQDRRPAVGAAFEAYWQYGNVAEFGGLPRGGRAH